MPAAVIGVGAAAITSTTTAVFIAQVGILAISIALQEVLKENPEDNNKSDTYNYAHPRTTIQEGIPIAKAYGVAQVAGNVVRSNDPAQSYLKLIIIHGNGPIEEISSWKFNKIEYSELESIDSNWLDYETGTFTQTIMQKGGSDFFDKQPCAYRGLAYTAVSFKKDAQINGVPSVLVSGRMSLCEPIGGGAKVFSRNPAVVMWDFYRSVDGYEIADLSIDDFKSLEDLCDAFPTNGKGVPLRPIGPTASTVKATSRYSEYYSPLYAVDVNKQLEGSDKFNQWKSAYDSPTNQCFNVDLSKSLVLTDITLINGHDFGLDTDVGIKNFVIQGSNSSTAFANVTYADDTGWSTISNNHVASQYVEADPYQTYETNTTSTAYRYYRLKIADSHRETFPVAMYIRDISFSVTSPRYTFDYNFDNKININDAKKMIWASFNGACIKSQGKIKPVWDWHEEADGAQGLTEKASKHSFTLDNIIKNSFTRWKPKRYNTIHIRYIDTHRNFMKTSLTVRDDADIDDRGEIPFNETCYFITQEDTIKRRAQQHLNKTIYSDYMCKLSGFSDSSDLELFDLVTVTHPLAGWTNKKFIIVAKNENSNGQSEFQLRAYYAGIYGDQEGGAPESYFSRFQNPNDIPYPSSNVSLSLVTLASGISLNAVKVSFDPPTNDAFYSYSEIYASNDDSTYYLTGSSSGEDFVIQGLGSIYQIDDTCYVKLLNVNTSNVKEPMPSAYDASIVVTGAIVISGGVILSDLEAGSEIDGQYLNTASITADSIANATITADQIALATITGNQIANATIQGSNIGSATIQGVNIENATISGTNITEAAITSDHIVNGTIVGGDMALATITGDKIYNGTIIGEKIDLATISGPHLIDGTILGRYIDLATISGANLAQATIAGEHIAQGTITTGNIENATICGCDIDTGTIEGLNIASATITGGNIGTGEIGAVNIENSSITGGKIEEATISGSLLVNQTITAGKIEDLTITASQIANLTIVGGAGGTIASGTISDYNIVANTITALQIATDTITADQIAGNTITASEIAVDTITASEIDTANAFIGMTIQSTAFNTGVTGWQINKNGDVEFNDGTFRGSTTWTGNIINTSYTAAKCTDANADRTSTHTANNTSNVSSCPASTIAGWRYGSTTYINGGDIYTNTITASRLRGSAFGTLTITSGKIAINTIDALEIQASGNIKVLAGGNINMYGSLSNPSRLCLYDPNSSLGASICSYSNNYLYFMPGGDGTRYFQSGDISNRWYRYNVYASNYITLQTRTNSSNFNQLLIQPLQTTLTTVQSGVSRHYYFNNSALYPSTTKTIDLGKTTTGAWDNVVADDFVNVADFYNFDVHDDLAAIKGIKGSGIFDETTGYEIIDDTTLPLWLISKHKKDGEIREESLDEDGNLVIGDVLKTYKKGDAIYDFDGRVYLSLKVCVSLAWGAIRQLTQKVEDLEESLNKT